jgi:hypothetical protein
MWGWRRTEKIIWTDRERNEVFKSDKVKENILQTMKRRKANWIGHILGRNCFQKRVFEGKIEGRIGVRARRGRGRKQLLNDLKEMRGCWSLKEETLDRTVWRTRFGRARRPVVRQTT